MMWLRRSLLAYLGCAALAFFNAFAAAQDTFVNVLAVAANSSGTMAIVGFNATSARCLRVGTRFTAIGSGNINVVTIEFVSAPLTTLDVQLGLYNSAGSASVGSQVGTGVIYDFASVAPGQPYPFDTAALNWTVVDGSQYWLVLAPVSTPVGDDELKLVVGYAAGPGAGPGQPFTVLSEHGEDNAPCDTANPYSNRDYQLDEMSFPFSLTGSIQPSPSSTPSVTPTSSSSATSSTSVSPSRTASVTPSTSVSPSVSVTPSTTASVSRQPPQAVATGGSGDGPVIGGSLLLVAVVCGGGVVIYRCMRAQQAPMGGHYGKGMTVEQIRAAQLAQAAMSTRDWAEDGDEDDAEKAARARFTALHSGRTAALQAQEIRASQRSLRIQNMGGAAPPPEAVSLEAALEQGQYRPGSASAGVSGRRLNPLQQAGVSGSQRRLGANV